MIKGYRLLREQIGKIIALLLSLVIGGIVLKTHLNPEKPTTLKLGYSFFGSIHEIDPSHIQSIYQSNIIENLFSRLIEYDNVGQIICGLCSSFKVNGNTIQFAFNSTSKTIDGYIVDAQSAKVSLERIIRSETNTHGSLKFFLDATSESPVEVTDNQLLIKVAKPEWTQFVINLLASMDFSIIPKESLDSKKEKIINYKNTSGLYYVDFSDDKGHIRLRANLYHKNFNSKMPLQIQFVPILPGTAFSAFRNQEIDMIDPTYYAYKEDINQILSSLENARVHQTLNIGLTNLVFTSRAMTRSTIEERLAVASIIKNVFLNKAAAIYGAEITDQFFQSFGQGFLTSEQHQTLRNRIETISHSSKYVFVLGLTEIYRKWISQEDLPDYITLKFFKQSPGFLPESEKPDVYIRSGDSSFDEDISALSYLFSMGTFSLNKNDGTKWIQNYMDVPSKKDRIELLRALHYEMLYTVKVFPIISRPYIAISNEKWDFDFPKIYAGTPLWKVWAR